MKTPPELRENPGYQLWLVTNAWQRSLRRVLHPLGLTHVQFAVLSSVVRLQDGDTANAVTQADVCRCGSLDQNMASEVVRSLQSNGYISRLEHPTDRRAHRLELTDKGMDLYLRAREVVLPVKDAFFAPLGESSKQLAGMLEVLAQAAEAEGR